MSPARFATGRNGARFALRGEAVAADSAFRGDCTDAVLWARGDGRGTGATYRCGGSAPSRLLSREPSGVARGEGCDVRGLTARCVGDVRVGDSKPLLGSTPLACSART